MDAVTQVYHPIMGVVYMVYQIVVGLAPFFALLILRGLLNR